jgi:hypothetical protein
MFRFVALRSDADGHNGAPQGHGSSSADTTTERSGCVADRDTNNCTTGSTVAVANGASSNRSSATIP